MINKKQIYFFFFILLALCRGADELFAQSTSNKAFSGSSQMSFNYNSLSNNPQQLPPAYMLWSGSQHFGYGGLPFELDWNISSASPYERLLPSAFSVKFDAENFRKDLRQRAEQQIKSESMDRLQNKMKGDEIKKEKEAIGSFFENTQVKEQMAAIARHDSLSIHLEKNKETLSIPEKENLQKEIERLKPATANREALHELTGKKKELDSLDKVVSQKDTLKEIPAYDYARLQNPSELKKELLQRGKLSRAESAGMLVERFRAGRFSPYWSDNVLRGVTVDGAELAVSPGNFYTGVIAGTLYPWQMLGLPSTKLPFPRNMIAAQAGYGRENSTNIRIHVLQFKDNPADNAALYPPSPKANYIVSLSGEAHAWGDKIFFKGALSGSQTTNTRLDNSEPLMQTNQITVPAPDNPSQWLNNILYQKQNSLTFSTDKAFNGEIRITPFKSGPAINSEIKYTGTYYQSFGSPFLPTDYRMLKSGIEQSIWKNKIFVTGNISNFHDNLSGLKNYTSYWNNYVTGLRFIFPASIQMLCTYKIIQQTSPVNYLYHFVAVQTNHIYLKNFWKSVSSLNYTAQLPGAGAASHSLMASSDIVSPAGHRLFSSLTGVLSGNKPLFSFQLTPQYVLFRKWSNGIGVNYYSLSNFYSQKGIHYETSLKFSEKFTFSLRAEYKKLENFTNGASGIASGNQWYLTSRVIAFW